MQYYSYIISESLIKCSFFSHSIFTAGRPHPMACTDIVIGKVHGATSHIADYYTRDRATPRLDTFWGGMDDVTAAAGIQYADRSRFIFRKKLKCK